MAVTRLGMNKLTNRRNVLLLSILLVVLVAANLIIFVPYFLKGKQMLTAEELQQRQQRLSQVATSASNIVGHESSRARQADELSQDLEPLEKNVDEVILELRTTAYPVDLAEEVKETLRLAEILSFTLRNTAVKGAGDTLTATKTSQILKQSAQSVDQLSRNYQAAD